MDKKRAMARRKKSIRKKISGTVDRPRMCINKSLNNLGIQIIDDIEGKTLFGLTTMSKSVSGKISDKTKKNIKAATLLGEYVAKMASEKGIKKVVFDRAGYRYHGVVKAFADAARENGLEF